MPETESVESRPHLREVWLQGWVLAQLRVEVLIVDVVAHTDELLSVVGAGDEDNSHAHGVSLRDEGGVGGISLREIVWVLALPHS